MLLLILQRFPIWESEHIWAVKDTIEGGTGMKLPSKIDPHPNQYFDKLKENSGTIQNQLNDKNYMIKGT